MMTINQEAKSRLLRLLAAEEEKLGRNLDRVQLERKRGLSWALRCLDSHALTKGTCAYYLGGDAAAFRQWFYVGSKLVIANFAHAGIWERGGNGVLGMGGCLLYALLSDNEEVIQTLARAENELMRKERNNPLYPAFHVHMIQLTILGEDSALLEKVAKLAKNGEKRYRKEAAAGEDFYTLLVRRDKAALERYITGKSAKIKSADILFEDVMSYLGTLQTKLCWYRGIDVQIDSPLVPMELMPVRPLPRYDNHYDFLEPGWKPPVQGRLGRLLKWWKER